MSKYRNKPIVVEAFQMTKENRWASSSWPDWLKVAWSKKAGSEGSLYVSSERLLVGTLENILRVDWNDWIIQGVQGELYPCKPNIFEQTYEKVED